MANIFLDRLDAAPIQGSDFPFDFNQWLANVVDTLNEVIIDLQNALNIFNAPSYTATEINDLFTAGSLSNGVILYDTTNDVYVGMQAGSLTKFTTASYP